MSNRRLAVLSSLALSLASALTSPWTGAARAAEASVSRSAAVGVVDGRGKPLSVLDAGALRLAVDGRERTVAKVRSLRGAGGAPGPWRIVLYFDRVLSGTPSLRAGASVLAEALPTLVALGEVEVLVAEPEPRPLVPATREIAPLEEALARLALSGEGRDDLRRQRARFAGRRDGESALPADAAAEALAAEVRTAVRQQDRLLELLAAEGGDEPRALFLVTDGFDLDPAAFYLGAATGSRASALERSAQETARAAAALGWTVFALRLGDEKLPDLRRVRLGSGLPNVGARVTLPVRRGERRAPREEPLPALAEPAAPLVRLAAATGGEISTERAAATAAIASLGDRFLVTWEEPELPAGAIAPLEIRARAEGLTVRAPSFVGNGIPAELAAARARAVLAGEELDPSFPLGAEIRSEAGASRLELRLLEEDRPRGAGALRALVLDVFDGEPTTVSTATWDPAAGEPFEAAIPSNGGPLAVVLDEPATGRFGVALVGAAEPAEAEVATVDPAAPIASAGPRRGFSVRIVRPGPGPAEGAVEVEADVRAPKDGRIERVEFSWNDELAAIAYEPPFRRRVAVPRGRPIGFLRAVAYLVDGASADDAVLVNAGAPGARVDVRLVEVPVVVTDRDGRPVRGLVKGDFKLTRGGAAQEIAGFGDAGDLPLTLALAVDTSASMFLKLPRVERAARTLLARDLSPRDRALLVDFDSTPKLLARPTRDLPALASALEGLRADGGTALWSAVVFALDQLAPVVGRKALIVYSDGVGEEDAVSFRDCLAAARSRGVPIYLILSTTESARRSRALLAEPIGEKLERLARATGGAAYFLREDDDLDELYGRILAELRSQYLLTFYPPEGADGWQELEVLVLRPGLVARTYSGFEPRARPR